MNIREFVQKAMKNSSKKSNIESRYKKAERQFNHVKDMPYGSERVNCLMEITTDVECMVEDYNRLVPLAFPVKDSGECYDYIGNKINPEDIGNYSTDENDYRFYNKLIILNANIGREITDDMVDNTSNAKQNQSSKSGDDYFGIAKALEPYVKGASDSDFQTIIVHKALPTGAEQKEWIGSRADACRFCQKFKLQYAQFNKCFRFANGKPLLAQNKKGVRIERKGSIWGIVSKYP